MMVAHREFSAWINCDGFVMDEYEVRVDTDGPKATCWIPSVAGKVSVELYNASVPLYNLIILELCRTLERPWHVHSNCSLHRNGWLYRRWAI